ncbi:TPA: FecR family protein [Klebsiella variicola subsp. variicola]|uniref:FecR family protein n=1 Tax=Klebsiella variicola TaxID=244366 RepID=UPI001255BAE4|nr:FecR domain-containing protein [Klebsiella variicola]MCX2362008.1 FecR domain-containing protein [Klebsiella variicola]VAT76788.1 iron(III) dicitrate transmembrane sensor protein FecR [Klebsiella variicola]HDZ0569293.1 FecR domain-containing protein [Klebsiella quasipneumoniae]
MARLHPEDSVAQRAIEWMVLLRSGEASARDYDNYLHWRRAQPAHEHACRRIEQTLGQFQPLLKAMPAEPLRQALLAPSSRRKAIQYGTGTLATVALGAALLNQHYPLSPLLADVKTVTAERRTLSLDDGSSVTLDARTALNFDVKQDNAVRQISLLNGGILLEAAEDGQRPFQVITRQGTILALGSRLNIRYDEDGVHVGVLDNVAKITNRRGQSGILQTGQGMWFDERSLLRIAVNSGAETAWTRGRLEVQDRSLISVIRSLRNYTSGIIRVAPSVAGLRVSGNFPLDDINFTLDSLAQTMPIAIVHTTDYWIHIQPARYAQAGLNRKKIA